MNLWKISYHRQANPKLSENFWQNLQKMICHWLYGKSMKHFNILVIKVHFLIEISFAFLDSISHPHFHSNFYLSMINYQNAIEMVFLLKIQLWTIWNQLSFIMILHVYHFTFLSHCFIRKFFGLFLKVLQYSFRRF